jgi:hypothetical protein
VGDGEVKEAPSFLKKRSKKLLSVGGIIAIGFYIVIKGACEGLAG